MLLRRPHITRDRVDFDRRLAVRARHRRRCRPTGSSLVHNSSAVQRTDSFASPISTTTASRSLVQLGPYNSIISSPSTNFRVPERTRRDIWALWEVFKLSAIDTELEPGAGRSEGVDGGCWSAGSTEGKHMITAIPTTPTIYDTTYHIPLTVKP